MDTACLPYDLYALDATFTEEQRAIVRTLRQFVDHEVLPAIGVHHDQETFPEDLFAKLKTLGILEAVAAGEMDPTTYGLAMRELERGSSTLRSILSVQGSLVMGCLTRFGSEEQKRAWLAPLGAFERIGCFGLTEPDFGSNPSGMLTRAEPTPGGYRITGTKMWITNGTRAHMALVWARCGDSIRCFLVETDRPGFTARAVKGKWSFRSSDTAELHLDHVEVPASAALPGAQSLGAALKCLNQARHSIAWGVVGAARGCLEETVNYLKQRVQFDGKPLASHQLIQGKIAWMAAELTAMELIARRLGELNAAGTMQPHQVSLAKMNNCRKALDIARTCRELLGANGIHSEYHVGRRMVDLETVITYEGTEHIHALTLGAALTGIKAFE